MSVVPGDSIAGSIRGLDDLENLALASGQTHLLRLDDDSVVGLGCHDDYLHAPGHVWHELRTVHRIGPRHSILAPTTSPTVDDRAIGSPMHRPEPFAIDVPEDVLAP
jgi:hypothetical protein